MHTKPYLLLLLVFFCFVLSFPPLSFGVVLAFQWPLFMLKTFPHTCKQGLRGTNSTFSLKEQGTGIVVKALSSNQCGPGSIPELDGICGLSLLMVPILAPRGFSPGTLVFPSPQKPTFTNSNSIWITAAHFIMSLWLRRLPILGRTHFEFMW